MPEHTDELKAWFRTLVPERPDVEVRPMFGSVGAFVNGNMFAGLFGEDVGVKPGDDALAVLDGTPGTGPFGPAERPMGGWRSLPAGMSDADKAGWFARAADHVATLPPKVRKARAARR